MIIYFNSLSFYLCASKEQCWLGTIQLSQHAMLRYVQEPNIRSYFLFFVSSKGYSCHSNKWDKMVFMCIRAVIVLFVQVPKFMPDKRNYVAWHSIAAQRHHATCSLMAFKTPCVTVLKYRRWWVLYDYSPTAQLWAKTMQRKVNSSNLEPGHKDPTPQEKQLWQELWVQLCSIPGAT